MPPNRAEHLLDDGNKSHLLQHEIIVEKMFPIVLCIQTAALHNRVLKKTCRTYLSHHSPHSVGVKIKSSMNSFRYNILRTYKNDRTKTLNLSVRLQFSTMNVNIPASIAKSGDGLIPPFRHVNDNSTRRSTPPPNTPKKHPAPLM